MSVWRVEAMGRGGKIIEVELESEEEWQQEQRVDWEAEDKASFEGTQEGAYDNEDH